jgi:hypothetical protein
MEMDGYEHAVERQRVQLQTLESCGGLRVSAALSRRVRVKA